ncbi:MAG: Wzz/FepE/Etk N-terminal domain-containing protein [Janthinobacterium lividum]
MSLAQLWAIFRAAWLSIAGMVVAASLAAYLFSSSLPKEYAAKARVMLNIGNNDPTQFSALGQKTEDSYIATQIRLISDDAVLRDVVTKLGWPSDPGVVSAWEESTGGAGDVTSWAAARLKGNIEAHQFEDSSIVEIYYTAQSVEIAKAIVALIRTSYIDNDLRLRVEAARKASAWNRTVAAQTLVALRKAEANRAAFLKANDIPIDTSNGNLETRELTSLRSLSVPAEGPLEEPVITSMMNKAKQKISDLDAQIAVMSADRGSSDPAMQTAVSLRDVLRAELARETDFANASGHATDALTAATRVLRDKQYLEARMRILNRAPVYDQLAAIDRDLALRVKLYTNAAQRVLDFDVVAAAPSGLQVIGDVIANDDMIFPNTPLTVGLAAGISLVLGLAIALFSEMMRRMVRGAADLEFYSGAPVMAVIAETPPPKRRFGRLRLRPAV